MASDRDGCGSGCEARQPSIRARSSSDRRSAVTGVLPVAGGPRFFLCITGIDDLIKPCITRLPARWKASTFTPGLTATEPMEFDHGYPA